MVVAVVVAAAAEQEESTLPPEEVLHAEAQPPPCAKSLCPLAGWGRLAARKQAEVEEPRLLLLLEVAVVPAAAAAVLLLEPPEVRTMRTMGTSCAVAERSCSQSPSLWGDRHPVDCSWLALICTMFLW